LLNSLNIKTMEIKIVFNEKIYGMLKVYDEGIDGAWTDELLDAMDDALDNICMNNIMDFSEMLN